MAQESKDADEPEEPNAADDALHFVVGQDRAGLWVVAEAHGLCGGIFSSKDAALRFAKSESADRKADLAMTPDGLEFRPPRGARF
jgi:hypothetical protein